MSEFEITGPYEENFWEPEIVSARETITSIAELFGVEVTEEQLDYLEDLRSIDLDEEEKAHFHSLGRAASQSEVTDEKES